MCRDLRDCQIYFPCSFFVTGYLYPPTIQQCPNDLIFSEEKQQCVQPTKKEDFACLVSSKYSTKAASSVKEISRKVRPKTTTAADLDRDESTEEAESQEFKLIPGINDYEPETTKTAVKPSRPKHFKSKSERSMKKEAENTEEPTFSRQLSSNADDSSESEVQSPEEVSQSNESTSKRKSSAALTAKKPALTKKNIKKQVTTRSIPTTTEKEQPKEEESSDYEMETEENG